MAEKIGLRFIDRETKRRLTAKECLAVVTNGWLYDGEIEQARRLAEDPAVTEAQAEAYLSELEMQCGSRLQQWRNYL